ncbi:uncharacterized protein ASPGLDRAFT_37485 [Aspergillus glaucus CBS 516.65]|uniref:Major facilitator superfamily (MFS) profile domain-containing protein n=1 Tax=Aspergillus glaucus CBS 516.65 TaxID=1160497 RepID=A0A1L9VE62_ASPGL|nr:hypothetical protein ASPGLDRAFT_37485 [Aspergillus glaucus CBS 516.65]OJJ82183.1 hypothetical protein ASPGLDRAFT_37485 [Aspergillus glaucus CBS 516.65]
MDVFYAYTYTTAGWLSVQSAALTVAPQIIMTTLLDETRPPTPLEIYFARTLGFSLLTLATLVIMLTGSVPLSTTVTEAVTTDESDPKAPYAVPTLMVSTIFQGVCAFYAYTWYTFNGQAAFAVGVLGYTIAASIGLWCLLFASSHGKISRKTGADKRTTGFPFSNSEAERKHAGKNL